MVPRRSSGAARDFPGRSPLLRDAYDFAREAHAGQRLQSDGAPYFHHPLAVGAMLHEAGFPAEVAAAGLLHDTLEDSEASADDLAERFGRSVARLVESVTEPEGVEPYEARKAAHRGRVVAAGYESAAIFAADKLSSARNLRGALAVRGEAAVDEGLEQPLERKLLHYQATLRELEELAPSLPFLPDLRTELERLGLQRRTALARQAIDGFNRRDLDTLVEACDRDVEWSPPLPTEPRLRPYRGHAGLRRYLEDLDATWESARAEIRALRDLGDGVVASCRLQARERDGADTFEGRSEIVFSVRSGRIARARSRAGAADEDPAARRPGSSVPVARARA